MQSFIHLAYNNFTLLMRIFLLCILLSFYIGCKSQHSTCSKSNYVASTANFEQKSPTILTGAQQTELYINKLQGKKVGLVINQTAEINGRLLVDTLISRGINIVKIFGPEHGFRGDADAGEKLNNDIDSKTGIPIVSLYGKKEAPSPLDLNNIDLLIFDIQDVGARFYTYTITLSKVMEACAENNIPLLVLDRPNPNGNLIDGPILESGLKSGVGLHPIPIGHGITIGEFAMMVNGENWLKGNKKCAIEIIPVKNYTHQSSYIIPVKPSPNLNNQNAIYGYPSICLFEGTAMSLGRGTNSPFQLIGHPKLKQKYSFSFTPKSIVGMSKNPPLENMECYGVDLNLVSPKVLVKSEKLNLFWLIKFYNDYPDKEKFFNAFFNKLAGNSLLKEQIIKGIPENEIRKSWEPGLIKYKQIRKKYLLYP